MMSIWHWLPAFGDFWERMVQGKPRSWAWLPILWYQPAEQFTMTEKTFESWVKFTEASLAFCRRTLGITGILRSKIIWSMWLRWKIFPQWQLPKRSIICWTFFRSPMWKRKKSPICQAAWSVVLVLRRLCWTTRRYLSWTNRQQDSIPESACVCGISFPSFRMIESCWFPPISYLT